jgi:hypothetical protein
MTVKIHLWLFMIIQKKKNENSAYSDQAAGSMILGWIP